MDPAQEKVLNDLWANQKTAQMKKQIGKYDPKGLPPKSVAKPPT